MTRFAIEGGLDSETAYNTSDLYIYNMNKCISIDEVLDLHFEMVSYFTKCMQNLKKENMLKNSDYSCSEISSFLAFNSQSHFTEAFRKKNGVTPKQFRDKEYKHHISR